MKYYLANIIPRLKKYSANLDQSAFLVDKPWVVSTDNDTEYEKLIFRPDGRVHLSSNGNVSDGHWEYLPDAELLLIDYGNQKKLYRRQFLDEAILVLKIDTQSTTDNFFVLINENLIPDLNVDRYLKEKYLSNNLESLSDSPNADNNHIKCKTCGKLNDHDVLKCDYCGRWFG